MAAVTSGNEMNTLQGQYIDALLALIRDRRGDPLQDVLLARLTGDPSMRHGLASPALGRDEPDEAALILVVYDRLAQIGDADATAYFRHALVDMIEATFSLTKFDERMASRLGHLVAYCRVVEDEALAGRLRRSTWGLLTGYLSTPLREVAGAGPETLLCARMALDLWLAITPPNLDPHRGLSSHLVEELCATFAALLGKFEGNDRDAWYTGNILLLLYRGVMKVAPERAGKGYFWRMCMATYHGGGESLRQQREELREAWLGLCWEYGQVFRAHPSWERLFFRGIGECVGAESRYEGQSSLPPLKAVEEPLSFFGAPGQDVINRLAKPVESSNVVDLVKHLPRKAAG